MAEGHKHFYEFGYPDERFETVLSENLHCAICSCVLKDPVMCKNEHYFCRACITKHLENYQNCPSCNQDLNVESLADAPRIVRNLLSEQKIRCDHHVRGCEEFVQLGNLASHVAVCGKAPVMCANEECSSEINREDKFRHESEECRFREVKCRNCKEMGSMVQEIGTSLGGLCKHVVEKLDTSVNEMKTGLTAVGNRFGEMENRLEKVENRFEEMLNRFEKLENQLLNIEDPRFRDGQREGVHDVMESARSDQATSADPNSDMKDARNPKEYAYIVAGGYGNQEKLLNSAEVFDKTSNSWRKLQPMKNCRANASSVVYNGQVLVAGGISDGRHVLSSLEQFSRFWSNFPVNLPKLLRGHSSVLCNDRMFVIGGYDEQKKDYSDMIYEIQLRFPFNTKVLAKLPSSTPIQSCGVVLVNNKILMLGGFARGQSYSATANVTMYDITKNEFQELAPLPCKVWNMATVKYEENVILAGCPTVVSYNVETQKSVMLPPMNDKRSECCAVVDGHSIVVMGGHDHNYGIVLNSVKAFDFRSSQWRNLPAMKEARKGFIAAIV